MLFARLVMKNNKPPLIVLLAPSVDPNYECLLEVQLPFAEDVRSYRFPPLDKIVTISGITVTEHRNLPDYGLLHAMSRYVDSMEITPGDESGEPYDTIPLDEKYSPVLHRINQAIRQRAIHPSGPLPSPSSKLMQVSQPSEELQARSWKYLERLAKLADVKKVPPKTKGRKRNRQADKPLSGLDVDGLLHHEKRTKISSNNTIPEFKQALVNADNMEGVSEAVNQMGAIIKDQIRNSLGDANYDRVVEELGVMKDELISYEEPGLYNDFLRRLKKTILQNELAGDRRELWWFIRRSNVGLIDKSMSELSNVTEQEAREFLSSK